MAANAIEALFAGRLTADPGAPLITYYNGATGERMELSAKSLANWVAKTHFLLIDELGLGAGDVAHVDLPMHWMAAPVLLGCWTAGLAVSSEPDGAACSFVGADAVATARAAGVPDIYALSFATWGRGFDGPAPDGAEDYVLAVRPQPDSWAGVRFGGAPDDPAWHGPDGAVSRAALVDLARERAAAIGLASAGRLLSAEPWSRSGRPGWLDALAAPLAVGASTVLVTQTDAVGAARIIESERATATLISAIS